MGDLVTQSHIWETHKRRRQRKYNDERNLTRREGTKKRLLSPEPAFGRLPTNKRAREYHGPDASYSSRCGTLYSLTWNCRMRPLWKEAHCALSKRNLACEKVTRPLCAGLYNRGRKRGKEDRFAD